MKISHNWLQEFVDIRLRPEELSEALNMLGIEVEGFEDRRSMYDGFVIAEVRTKEKHPKADKLSVCTVFDGTELRTVVCGAPN
ncbi:MAG: phenylalanine--tRNA ligase subunit beta, partial [Candidatus Kapaibacterium sp.]